MDSGLKDEELIAKIGQGNEGALVALMERHKQPVYQFVYRYLNNSADAAEVAEVTFFKVYQNAARYKVKAAPKTWIFSIALNLCRDRLRKEKKRKGHVPLDDPTARGHTGWALQEKLDSGVPAPSQSAISNEEVIRIQNKIAQLPEKLKFPFIYCILEEHSYDECAAILKASRKTVETRIYRARQSLRKQLEKDYEKI